MSRIHIVTPLSREKNLEAIFASVNIKSNNQIFWWLIVDGILSGSMDSIMAWADLKNEISHCYVSVLESPFTNALAGHAHRNHALEIIKKGYHGSDWFYQLDDDNLLHPGLPAALCSTIADLVLVDQLVPRRYLRFLFWTRKASPSNVKLGSVDTAQVAFRIRAAEGLRWREDLYSADGLFIEELYARKPVTIFINNPLSYYNRLR